MLVIRIKISSSDSQKANTAMHKRYSISISIALAIIGNSLTAQTNPRQVAPNQVVQPSAEVLRLCKSAEGLLEDGLKAIAYESFAGILDNSAPRETNRQLKIVAATTGIQVQQAHLQSLGCPALLLPITHAPYISAAISCSLAKGDEIKEKCDRKSWVRSQSKPD